MDKEQIDIERIQLKRCEDYALAVLRSIHFMQRDIAYVDAELAEQEDLGGKLSEQKEIMLNGVDVLAYYCGFELTRLEETD